MTFCTPGWINRSVAVSARSGPTTLSGQVPVVLRKEFNWHPSVPHVAGLYFMGGGIFSCFASNSVSPATSSLRSLSADSRQASIVFRWSLDSKPVVSLRTPDSRLRLAISPVIRSGIITRGLAFESACSQQQAGDRQRSVWSMRQAFIFRGREFFPQGSSSSFV